MPDVRKFWDEDGHYKCRFCNKAHPNSYDTFVKIETRKAVGFGSCQFRGILNAGTKKEIVQETHKFEASIAGMERSKAKGDILQVICMKRMFHVLRAIVAGEKVCVTALKKIMKQNVYPDLVPFTCNEMDSYDSFRERSCSVERYKELELETFFMGFPILAQIAKLRKWLRKRNLRSFLRYFELNCAIF